MEPLKLKLYFQLEGRFEQKKIEIPLKSQEIQARVMNSIATVDLCQRFENNSQNPLEISLKIPVDQDYAVGKLIIEIEGNIIEGKVLEKRKAEEKYEDAISQGHTAALAKQTDDEEGDIEM